MVMVPACTDDTESRPSGLMGDLWEVPLFTVVQLEQGGARTFIEFGSSRITHAIASLGRLQPIEQVGSLAYADVCIPET